MSILRRTTIEEFDNSVDGKEETKVPSLPLIRESHNLSEDESTKVPTIEGNHDASTDDASPDPITSKITGRTPSDIFVESERNPRRMFIFFYVISFSIFLLKMDFDRSVYDNFRFPIFLGTFLNIIWFGLNWIASFFVKKKK